MLKIKDNVDLKELEKYGFKQNFDYEGYASNIYWVLKKDKIIRLSMNGNTQNMLFEDNRLEDILYDLIKADLVEKVDE